MNLTSLLNLKIEDTKVILVGIPEETNILDSKDQPYMVAKLKSPVNVRCSVDPEILAHETDEVYFRKSALESDGWVALDEKKPEEGFYMPGWVIDFSKSQMIALYQETSIKTYFKNARGNDRSEQRTKINNGLREKILGKNK